MKQGKLVVTKGAARGEVYELGSPEVLIGRDSRADIQIADKAISREHAVLLWENDELTIEDLQSTNGTKLNGKPLRSSAVQNGDEIEVGETVFLVVIR